MSRCFAEMCSSWTGHGCACEVFGVDPDIVVPDEHRDHDIHGLVIEVHTDGSTSADEDCDCPPNCIGCEIEGVAR